MRLLLCVLVLALAGCAVPAKRDAPRDAPARGAYYKDDGPGENPPPNLAAIPDAEPQAEPPHRYANRRYEVFGKEYTPLAS
ncbi:MAG: septal ring lytic transglycosylase RlpA family protein, partial [Burkholderiales bacterium]